MINKGKSKIRLFAGVLFALTLLTKSAFLDTFYQYSFEADSPACIKEVKEFYEFYRNPTWKTVPEPMTINPTYFDAPFMVSAFVATCLRPFVGTSKKPTEDSFLIFTMRNVGWVLSSLTVLLVFLTMCKLNRLAGLNFLFCLFYLQINSQAVYVDLIRVDHFMVFFIALQFFLAVSIVSERSVGKPYWALLGVASAFVVSTKLNSLQYLLIPAMTVALSRERSGGLKPLFWGFVFATCVVFSRWIWYWDHVPKVIMDTVDQAILWASYWSTTPHWSYNFHNFWHTIFVGDSATADQATGALLKLGGILTATALNATSIYAVWKIYRTKRNPTRTAPFLILICVLVFSIIAAASPKEMRHGLPFPNYYALGVAVFLSIVSFGKVAKAIMLAVFGLISTAHIVNAGLKAQQIIDVKESIIETRVRPKQWLEKAAVKGERIAYYVPHEAAQPPIFELNLDFSPHLLKIPYTNVEDCANFLPPSFADITKGTDFVLLENEHFTAHQQDLYEASGLPEEAVSWEVVRDVGYLTDSSANQVLDTLEISWRNSEGSNYHAYITALPKKYRLYAWQAFYGYLPKYFDEHVFQSDHLNYGIYWVKIYDLRAASEKDAGSQQ